MAQPTVRELLARLDLQQVQIEQLQEQVQDLTEPVLDDQLSATPAARVSRRGALKAAAVASAALGAVLAEPALASAAGPNPASFTSTNGQAAVKATNKGSGNAVQAIAGGGTTIHASQTGGDAGAAAIRGTVDHPKGKGTGVVGTSVNGSGVVGTTSSSEQAAIRGHVNGDGIGVIGDVKRGAGVIGAAIEGAGLFGVSNKGAGVSGISTSGVGVSGSSHSDDGVSGDSSSGIGVHGTSTTNNGIVGETALGGGSGVVGHAKGDTGNYGLYAFGNIGATGTKSAVVPATDGGDHLTLYCLESPEAWFEDFGSAALSGGSATVTIDPEFAQTIHTASYHVFLQAEGECGALSVRGKTATSFAVQEQAGGTSSVSFAYRIVALRRDVKAPRLRRTTLPSLAR